MSDTPPLLAPWRSASGVSGQTPRFEAEHQPRVEEQCQHDDRGDGAHHDAGHEQRGQDPDEGQGRGEIARDHHDEQGDPDRPGGRGAEAHRVSSHECGRSNGHWGEPGLAGGRGLTKLAWTSPWAARSRAVNNDGKDPSLGNGWASRHRDAMALRDAGAHRDGRGCAHRWLRADGPT